MPKPVQNHQSCESRLTALADCEDHLSFCIPPPKTSCHFDRPNNTRNLEDILSRIEDYSKRNLQSDQRYTEELVRVKFNAGKGPNFIENFLKAKQVSTELIKDELSQYSQSDWVELAIKSLRKKFKNDKRWLREFNTEEKLNNACLK